MSGALILTALFNGAWQGALLCGLASIAFARFRRLNATTMFTVWTALLVIAIALPAANLVFAPRPYTIRITQVRSSALHSPLAAYATRSHASTPVTNFRRQPPSSRSLPPTPTLAERAAPAFEVFSKYAFAVLWLLVVVACVRLSVLVRDVVRMLQARRDVRLIEAPVRLSGRCERPFQFAASQRFTSPCVLGFSPALIVLPNDVLASGREQLLSIILHEREHVRRFDDIQNVLQRLVGALAFFCPGVRIALRELALYREQICDDAAISGTVDRISYAMTLTDMAQWAQGRGAPVPSLIFKRKQLLHRLEVLLDSATSHSMRMNRRFVLTAAAATVLAGLLVVRVQVPVIAESVIAPIPPVSSRVHVQVPRAPVPPPPAPVKVHVAVAQTIVVVPTTCPSPAVSVPPLVPGKVTIAAIPIPSHVHLPLKPSVVIAPVQQPRATRSDDDLLDALNAAGLRNLSVDQLIAIRDHGVGTNLIRAAVQYFGQQVDAQSLTYLADHGVSSLYLQMVAASGVGGMTPAAVVLMQDHGVSTPLLREATNYFSPRPTATDLANLADHGVSSTFIQSLRRNGIQGVSIGDAIRLLDHGADASYIVRIRRANPHASIDDIIRLRDAGF